MTNINKQRLLNNLMEMDYSSTRAKSKLSKMEAWFNSLPQTIILFRVLHVKSENSINKSQIGSHFGANKQTLIDSRLFVDSGNQKMFLVTVKVDKSEIDVEETFSNRILFPHENEITIKDKGKNCKIVRVEEIKPVEELCDDDWF